MHQLSKPLATHCTSLNENPPMGVEKNSVLASSLRRRQVEALSSEVRTAADKAVLPAKLTSLSIIYVEERERERERGREGVAQAVSGSSASRSSAPLFLSLFSPLLQACGTENQGDFAAPGWDCTQS